jgi:hypothetical protein
MSILSIIMILIVVGVIIYAVRLALAGNWKQLIITAVILFLAVWVLSLFGISLPMIGGVK